VKPPEVGDDCHAFVFWYVTLQPVVAASAVLTVAARPQTNKRARRDMRWIMREY
jgi:hypothetical protein